MSSLPTFKLLVVGGVESGKTSIVTRYVYNRFDRMGTHTKIDIAVKHIYVDGNKTRLQFWDIAGQEVFVGLVPTYYASTSGAFIVVDITKRTSIKQITAWKNDLDSKVCDSSSL